MLSGQPRDYAVLAEGIAKVYGGSVRALDGVDLLVEEGSIHAVLGPNGAGKTTLMRILTTQLRPTAGRAFVMGYDVVRDGGIVRRLIGYVPQEFSVWSDITGYENLLIHSKLFGIPPEKRRSIIEEVLEFMELREAANRLVRTYSGGMIRRLEIAAALMLKPRILLLDEPTIGLDPRAREMVWARILQYRRESRVTVVFNTHYMDEAERYAEEITMLNLGRVVARGTPQELKKAVVGGDVIYLRVDRRYVDVVYEVLSKIPEVTVLSPNPASGVALSVPDASHALPHIVKALIELGVDVEEVNIKRPTLNEVFIKLAGMTVEQAESVRGIREAASVRRAIRRGG